VGTLPYGAALIGRILARFYLVSASALLTHSSTAMGKRYRKMRTIIAELVRTIQPSDPLERAHVAATLAWINSGAPIYRVAKPALPPQHLVAYFALLDPATNQLLLVDHKKAGLWLPGGGHVEPGEHPDATVQRELWEELRIPANFLLPRPLFLTVTQTVGVTAGHYGCLAVVRLARQLATTVAVRSCRIPPDCLVSARSITVAAHRSTPGTLRREAV